jgi:hypothetical protein
MISEAASGPREENMKNAKIQSILAKIAEEAAPTAEIDLWGKLRLQLETSESRFSKGETLMKPDIAQRPGVRRVTLASALAASSLVFFLFTHPGQALAQSILHFFARVTAPRIALTPVDFTRGNTLPEFVDTCGGYGHPTCTVAQMRNMVSFDVKGLSKLPDGMRFAGATGGPQLAMLAYANQAGGVIFVGESPWTEAADKLWEVSVSAVVETVTIGPLEASGESTQGEYTVGGWTGQAFRQWNPAPDLQTLRWRLGDTVYSMTSVGANQYQGRLLDKAGLAVLAAAMTADPDVLAATPIRITQVPDSQFTIPTSIPHSGRLQTVPEAEELAGFKVIEPTWLPMGYAFQHASYTPSKGNVCLFYAHTLDAGYPPSLVIIQNASGNLPDIPEWTRLSYEYLKDDADPGLYGTPAVPVPVGGALNGQAAVSRIGQRANLECGENIMMFDRTMLWKTEKGRSFIIMAEEGPFNPFLTTLETRRLAENLNGVSTIPANVIDPERLASAGAAERMLGSDILIPTRLPDGFVFDLAQYTVEDSIRTVALAYTYGNISFLSVTVRAGVTETLDDIFNRQPDMADRLTVRGQQATYMQGVSVDGSGDWCWDCYGAQILTWFENGMEYQITVRFSTITTKETLIEIAESMR